jgi:hypothetical protein
MLLGGDLRRLESATAAVLRGWSYRRWTTRRG